MVWYVERKYEGMSVVLKITWLGVRVIYMTGVKLVWSLNVGGLVF